MIQRCFLIFAVAGLLFATGCSDSSDTGPSPTYAPAESLCADPEGFDGELIRVVASVDWVELCGSPSTGLHPLSHDCVDVGASLSCGGADDESIAIVEPEGGIYRCGDYSLEDGICNDDRFLNGGEQAVVVGTFRAEPLQVPVDGDDSRLFEYTLEFETFAAEQL